MQVTPRRFRSDRGFVAVWIAITFSVMVGFAAFAVDLGNWYLGRSRAQNAADAAALGGVVFLPDDPDTAEDTVLAIASQHGFAATDVDITIGEDGDLKVCVEETVDNVFLPVIGFPASKTVDGCAKAAFERALEMGSPSNILGNDPEDSGSQPGFVLGLAGPEWSKVNGDRHQTRDCGGNYVANCGGSPVDNTEYSEDGYIFAIDVTGTNGNDLRVQIFDPAWVGDGSGQGCDYGFPSSSERTTLYNLTHSSDYTVSGDVKIPKGWFDDVSTRYQSGKSYWCLGDAAYGSYSYLDDMETTFILREPDDTPWTNLDNPVVDIATCSPTSFGTFDIYNSSYDSYTQEVYERLHPTAGDDPVTDWVVDPDDGIWSFSEVFRRWVNWCEIPANDVEIGTYYLQVRTNADPSDPLTYDPDFDTYGQNFFSLRAGFADGSGVHSANKVTLSATGRLPIFANVPGVATDFYLGRVVPVDRARTLTVEIFDLGDAASTGTLQILPPVESNISVFDECEFSRSDGASLNVSSSICRLNSIHSSYGFNGRTIVVKVTIPEDYDCTEESDSGCWVRMRVSYSSDVHDFTTWSTYVGDPVRLIE
ncbi:MAG: hypothetical protein KDB21_04990 [Acidimicrobiales bacterium]|nr:hypothetical protein [Acidimicrobiales bacterium]